MRTRGVGNKKADSRHSGVELLRILAAMSVIVLHFNYYPGASGAADYAAGFNGIILNLLECVCICAVNVFLLISGFFGIRAKQIKVRKLVLILLQMTVFRVAANIALGILSRELTVSRLLSALVPTNYYVTLYVCLMLISPYINAGLERLSDKALRRLVLIAVLAFSLYATLVDVLEESLATPLPGASPVGIDGSMSGYTIVHFVLMYLLGAWLRREEGKQARRIGNAAALGALAGSALLLYLWRAILPKTAWMYCNPLVIVEACAALLLFSRLHFSSRWINRVAPAAFTCYLIHEYALYFLDYQKIGESPFPMLIGFVIGIALGVYILSVIVYEIWNAIVVRVFPEKSEALTISAE